MSDEHYFAFIDTLEFTEPTETGEARVAVRLDIVPSTARLETDGQGQADSWQPSMVETEPDAASQVRQTLGVDLRDVEGRWFRTTLGREGVLARRFASPEDAGVVTRVGAFQQVAPDVQAQLERLSVLDPQEFPDATGEQLTSALGTQAAPDRVACYRVGQGNMNAVCDASAHPLVYYDLGGGSLRNAKTYPRAFKACRGGTPPILLSHWDTDHWVTARHDSRWLSHAWIAPRQRVGPTHRQLARDIKANGILLIWPTNLSALSVWFGEIARCSGTSRNDSGLITRVDLASGDRVLLPGDADYAAIPAALVASLNGMVASHHGAAIQGVPPTAHSGPAASAYVAISYGAGNSYKHPVKQERADLRAAGWRVQYLTPNGGVQFLAHLPKGPPCAGRDCTLSTPKP